MFVTYLKFRNMAVRYANPEEKFRNICTFPFPEELKELLVKWKINITLVADEMGMKRATLGNKIKGNLGASFSVEEYQDLIKVLRNMVDEIDPILNKYPLIEE